MDGVLVVDKPAGLTSHDVVARVRRALGESRIGHTGTLDPMATGVLPLVVGRATRLASMLSGAAKQYEAAVRFGCATDTFDATGRRPGDEEGPTAAEAPPAPPAQLDAATVERALEPFRGTFQQSPPRFSAKKIAGVAAYKLARRRQDVQPAPVEVTVHSVELLDYADGVASLRVTASAGFYVRSLAHDLGEALGVGGHLVALRRTAAGPFTIDDAVPLQVIQSEGGAAAARLIPLDRLLREVPGVTLTDQGARRARHGNAVGPSEVVDGLPGRSAEGRVRLLDPSGALLGLAEPRAGGLLQPVVVLV
jgi:tRNA pseudouridine55 synthase